MEVIISAKQFEVDEILKAQAEALAEKLTDSYRSHKLTSIRFRFQLQRNWQIADVLLHGKNLSLHASARTNDMRVSLANVVDKIDKQMRRYLERIQDQSTKASSFDKQKFWTSDELIEDGDNEDWGDDPMPTEDSITEN